MLKPWDFVGASCEGVDTEYFFPEDRLITSENKLAKKICSTCDFLSECLHYSLHHRVQGIWGGTDPRERDRMRKTLNIIPVPIIQERYHNDRINNHRQSSL
jgi:hypothetical protein